jgi:hypothetical protein
MIDVKVGGTPYQEMHVDGGASAQVDIYPTHLHVAESAKEAHITRERRVYVVRNSRLDPDWADTERRTFSIAARDYITDTNPGCGRPLPHLRNDRAG